MSDPILSPAPEADAPAAPFVVEDRCALCSNVLAAEATRRVNASRVCDGCADQVERELAAQKGSWKDYPLAIALGLGAALVSAAVWTAIVVITNYEVGYVAVGVGFLTGVAVKFGAGAARNQQLQILAAALSVVGLVLAKYFTFAHFFIQGADPEGTGGFSYVSPIIISAFPQYFTELLSPFDALWVIFAVITAYKVPAPTAVALETA